MIHKLTISLKQHTPLIHFQHDQDGASLRASEVKPKLDRFLLLNLGEEKYNSLPDDEYNKVASIYEKRGENAKWEQLDYYQQCYEVGKYVAKKSGWFVGKGDYPALKYKMFIHPKGRHYYHKLSLINAEKWLIYNEEIVLTLICPDILLDNIKKGISDFFIVNNMGYRQSKGYGSYLVTKIEEDGKNEYNRQQQLVSRDHFKTLSNYYYWVKKITVNKPNNYSINLINYFNHRVRLTDDEKKEIDKRKAFDRITKLCFNITPQDFNNGFVFRNCQEQIKREIEKRIQNIDRDCTLIMNYKNSIKSGLNECLNKIQEIHNDYLYSFFKELIDKNVTLKYQLYKSGQNHPYSKSQLRNFFGSLNGNTDIVYWDKRFMKQRINKILHESNLGINLKNNHINSEISGEPDQPDQTYLFIRALLGLEENFEFQTNDRNRKIVVSVEGVDCGDKLVERFQSIILFKIIENEIYVCLKSPDYLKKILNKKFVFKMKIKDSTEGSILYDFGSLGQINTPHLEDPKIKELYTSIISHFKSNK